MGRIASEALVGRLADWGVDTVFGMPGDGINGIMEALRRHADRVRFVLVHHEEAAALMATGYAKATGKVGVCLATSGSGGIHLASGLYDAKLDHVPVLAITGSQETSVLGTGYQQEIRLDRLFDDVAEYNQMVVSPVQLPSLVDDAIRTAYARRGVAHLTVPDDVQVADPELGPFQQLAPTVAPAAAPISLPAPGRPRDADLTRAAAALNAGKRIAIVVGIGARGAGPLVELVADVLGAPVMKTLPGKMVVPDNSRYTTGGIGSLGTKPSAELVEDVDTLLLLGTDFPYAEHLPEPGDATVVQVEIDPTRAGARLPTDVPLVGDVRATLEALLPLLQRRSDRDHLEKYQQKMREWTAGMVALREPSRDPIAPQYLAGLLDELAADDAILACDSGTVAVWAARHWTIRAQREFYLSASLATMACGLPYAIAMQHAYPDRQVIAYVGDGGFSMLMAELHTASWHRLPVKVVVNNNSSLGTILWEQTMRGFPEHGVRYGEPLPDYAGWARSCGAYGMRVDKPDQLADALGDAFAHDGPALVDVAVDPDEPPMPGKPEYARVKSFPPAFLRGQARWATTLFKTTLQQLQAK